ncbi:hypothetical protein PQC39_gp090 [Vibrio phage Vp_R1]|uniref:Uncharacterized protein n=1 Tax=Vibrio phage Vp_R1 TaxID=2059867 RepID=A0A2H5BQ45_9CAUD|nr:hypothetical protein PQC39_gp090 [Vibrio phage Vp_R1]AUG88454.1 hypothetical protein VPR_090 [Vibrio phage Vp_R1]
MSEKQLCGKHFRTPAGSIIRVLKKVEGSEKYACRQISKAGHGIAFNDNIYERTLSELTNEKRYTPVVLNKAFSSYYDIFNSLNKDDLKTVVGKILCAPRSLRFIVNKNTNEYFSDSLEYLENLIPSKLNKTDIDAISSILADSFLTHENDGNFIEHHKEVGELLDYIIDVAIDRRCAVIDVPDVGDLSGKMFKVKDGANLLKSYVGETGVVVSATPSDHFTELVLRICGEHPRISQYYFLDDVDIINPDYKKGDRLSALNGTGEWFVQNISDDVVLRNVDSYKKLVLSVEDVNRSFDKVTTDLEPKTGDMFHSTASGALWIITQEVDSQFEVSMKNGKGKHTVTKETLNNKLNFVYAGNISCNSDTDDSEKAPKLPKLTPFKGKLAKHMSEKLPVNYIFMVEESQWGVSPKLHMVTGDGKTVTIGAYDFMKEYEVVDYEYKVGDLLSNRKSGDKFKVSGVNGEMLKLERYDGFETTIGKYDVHRLLKLEREPHIEVGEYFYVTNDLNPYTFVIWKVKEVRASGGVHLEAVHGHKVPGTIITRNKSRLLDPKHFTRPFSFSFEEVMELDPNSETKGVDTSVTPCTNCGKVPKDLIICDGICSPCFEEVFKDVSGESIVYKNPDMNFNGVHVKPEEENKVMTRIVKVSIVDNSAGLKNDADRLVASFKNVVTTKTDEQVKMEILMGQDVASKLKAHNEKREKLVDEDILNRTGNEVNLRPVELHDLTWLIQE